MGLFFESVDESARSLQCQVKIVDTEEQEEAVARWRLVRAHQGGMLVRAPLMEAEQDGSIRIQDLTKLVMARSRLGLAEERLVPFEATRNVPYADDRPCPFHRISVGLRDQDERRRTRARVACFIILNFSFSLVMRRSAVRFIVRLDVAGCISWRAEVKSLLWTPSLKS